MPRSFYVKRFKRGIIIAPTKAHIRKLTDTLYFFSEHDPRMFKRFRSMRAILVHPGKGNEKEFGYWVKYKIWVVDTNSLEHEPVFLLASDLVHETQHHIQNERGSRLTVDEAEKEAYKKQRAFLVKFGNKNLVKELDEGFKEKWWVQKTPDGKEASHHSSKRVKKFVEDYKRGKLKLKEYDYVAKE